MLDPDELTDYHNIHLNQNPFYPVGLKDFDKLEPLCITKEGLKELHRLKRKLVMGNATLEDKVVLIDLLRIDATTNPSLKRAKNWKHHVDFYINDIIQTHFISYLEQDGFAVKNPKYNPKFMYYHDAWQMNVLQKIYALRESRN